MMKKLLAWLLAIILGLTGAALAEAPAEPKAEPSTDSVQAPAPALERKGIALGDGSVYYPQVTGMADAVLQEKVNALLLEKGNVEQYLNRLPLTMQSAAPLTVDYTAYLAGDVLSCVQLARGAVADERNTQIYTAVNVDLRTGESIGWADLFQDETAARAAVEEYLWDRVAPELSPHQSNSELTPLPECFGLTSSGMTLYYPISQLSTLSDKAGTVTILWSEVRELLRLEEGSVLHRLGAAEMLTLDEKSRASIEACVARGQWPDVPVALGGSVREATDTFGLLMDPDLYAQGRLFQLEGGVFRGMYLMSDSLTSGWDNSVIQGLRADRLNLFGLCTGQTERTKWLEALGEPDATVQVDAEQAEANRMIPGTSDYYRFGEHQLRLHADESGVLASVFITQ